MLLDEIKSPDESTFQPLKQEVHSNIKYNGMGYMPCNGYVPCQVFSICYHFIQLSCHLSYYHQPDHLDARRQRERIEGAMPCHNYQGKGDGADGCW